MTNSWNTRGESSFSRRRRAANLSSVKIGVAGLTRYQRTHSRWPRPGPDAAAATAQSDATWTTARVLAANVVVFCALGAVVVLVSSVLEHVTRQAFFVIFVLLTLSLIRRGSRLRARGLDRLGRSITAWAGATGSLVAVSGALSLGLTTFIPELIAVSAGWLLLLGVWKDLSVLVTAAVLLVGPIVWGAFLWNRSLVGAVLLVVAAGAYARSGTVHRALFASLVFSGVLVIVAAVHQATHPAGSGSFDGGDLLALIVVLTCLVGAGELESWHADWTAYGAIVRSVTTGAAVVLAALAARPGRVESWAAAAPGSAVPRVEVAGIVAMSLLWGIVASRPVAPGGRLKLATWTLVIMLLLGALTHAYSAGIVRWVAVAALEVWGLRAVRSGLRRSRTWPVIGGFAVTLGSALLLVAPQQGLVPLVLLLFAVAAAGAVVMMATRPEDPPVPGTPAGREPAPGWSGGAR